jgi:hypothetical protein
MIKLRYALPLAAGLLVLLALLVRRVVKAASPFFGCATSRTTRHSQQRGFVMSDNQAGISQSVAAPALCCEWINERAELINKMFSFGSAIYRETFGRA